MGCEALPLPTPELPHPLLSPCPPETDGPQGMGSLSCPAVVHSRGLGTLAQLWAQLSSLCRETALYGNLILKKGVLAPEALF